MPPRKKPAEAEVKPPVDRRPRVTALQVFRGAAVKDTITSAFLHMEGLNQKRIRKLTREEWMAALLAFRNAER